MEKSLLEKEMAEGYKVMPEADIEFYLPAQAEAVLMIPIDKGCNDDQG